MNSFVRSFSILGVVFALASCGEPERARPVAITGHPGRAGADFEAVGKVSLYPGESCASQIMFIFQGAGSTRLRQGYGGQASVSLAAPFKQSRILTGAAREHRTVRVWGKWQRGKAPGCSYVEATDVEVQKSFW